MQTIDPDAGAHLFDVLAEAVAKAPCRFIFNSWAFETRVGETLGDAQQRFEREHGFPVRTRKQSAENAAKQLKKIQQDQATAIADAKVPTEAELREMAAPWLTDIEELTSYIQGMVNRPHDYGTCVYAMSLSAVAAMYYVSQKLGVTGFQASCADIDILRRTRGLEFFCILDYSNLLYPQYCTEEHFPSVQTLLNDPEIKARLKEKAKIKLAEDACDTMHAAPGVIAHWKMLASN